MEQIIHYKQNHLESLGNSKSGNRTKFQTAGCLKVLYRIDFNLHRIDSRCVSNRLPLISKQALIQVAFDRQYRRQLFSLGIRTSREILPKMATFDEESNNASCLKLDFKRHLEDQILVRSTVNLIALNRVAMRGGHDKSSTIKHKSFIVGGKAGISEFQPQIFQNYCSFAHSTTFYTKEGK